MSRFPKYVSVSERKERNKRKINKIFKKNKDIEPIKISGRKIAKSWWGRSWNKNLEMYADYSNRLTRGRSYVRHGAVADLKIRSGVINAMIIGSGRSPYNVEIKIDKLSDKKYKNIIDKVENRISSLDDLIKGKFPKKLEELFTSKEGNLFPTDDEIHFACDCPDYAIMCKHVVATLYAVGAKLDEDPLLFFKLRNLEVGDLIDSAIEKTTEKLIDKSNNKSDRVIEESDMMDMFNIDLE